MIYTFKCNLCNRLFNETLTVEVYTYTGSGKRKCPHCGKIIIPTRVITSPTIIYNGTGFYSTDYRKKDNGNTSPTG